MDKKIILLGPLNNKDDKTNTGGIVVLFSNLLMQCVKNNIKYHVIDTNKNNYSNKLTAFLSIWFQLLMNLKKFEYVSLHGTAKDYLYIAPFVVFFSKLFGLHISLRKFAGNFDVLYDRSPKWKQYLVEYILRNSNVNFFETKYLVEKFRIFNQNTYWFPNVRERAGNYTLKSQFKKRFIFVGSITEEKGIKELLEVSNLLDESYEIDIYGKLGEDMIHLKFDNYRAVYKGSFVNTDVLKTMSKYDVLVLPSYREGYPGVLIEAISIGLPIVATNLQGIKEMVNNDMSVLIDPKNIAQLKNAIEYFNESNYGLMSLAALKVFKQFDSDLQSMNFFEKSGLL